MPRMQKRPVVEPIRRKCATCGSVKLVQHRSWTVPPTTQYRQPIYNPKTAKKRQDMPGVSVLNYCSIDCEGDEFINHYTADDFAK